MYTRIKNTLKKLWYSSRVLEPPHIKAIRDKIRNGEAVSFSNALEAISWNGKYNG